MSLGLVEFSEQFGAAGAEVAHLPGIEFDDEYFDGCV